ncbi:hypothetical protein Drorol1_Dr00018915 [Drosera rotundifolia]
MRPPNQKGVVAPYMTTISKGVPASYATTYDQEDANLPSSPAISYTCRFCRARQQHDLAVPSQPRETKRGWAKRKQRRKEAGRLSAVTTDGWRLAAIGVGVRRQVVRVAGLQGGEGRGKGGVWVGYPAVDGEWQQADGGVVEVIDGGLFGGEDSLGWELFGGLGEGRLGRRGNEGGAERLVGRWPEAGLAAAGS